MPHHTSNTNQPQGAKSPSPENPLVRCYLTREKAPRHGEGPGQNAPADPLGKHKPPPISPATTSPASNRTSPSKLDNGPTNKQGDPQPSKGVPNSQPTVPTGFMRSPILADWRHLLNDCRAPKTRTENKPPSESQGPPKTTTEDKPLLEGQRPTKIGRLANIAGDVFSIVAGAGGAAGAGLLATVALGAMWSTAPAWVPVAAGCAAAIWGYNFLSGTLGRIGHSYISGLANPENWEVVAGTAAGAALAAGAAGIAIASSAPLLGTIGIGVAALGAGYWGGSELTGRFFGDFIAEHKGESLEYSSYKTEEMAIRAARRKEKKDEGSDSDGESPSQSVRRSTASTPENRPSSGSGQVTEVGQCGIIGSDGVGQGRSGFGLPHIKY
jgi:hypothetical protein